MALIRKRGALMIGLYVINSTTLLTGLTEKRLYSYYCIYDLQCLQLHRPTIDMERVNVPPKRFT